MYIHETTGTMDSQLSPTRDYINKKYRIHIVEIYQCFVKSVLDTSVLILSILQQDLALKAETLIKETGYC